MLEDKKLTYLTEENKKTYIEKVLTSFEATARTMATIDPLGGVRPNWFLNNVKKLKTAIKYRNNAFFRHTNHPTNTT